MECYNTMKCSIQGMALLFFKIHYYYSNTQYKKSVHLLTIQFNKNYSACIKYKLMPLLT